MSKAKALGDGASGRNPYHAITHVSDELMLKMRLRYEWLVSVAETDSNGCLMPNVRVGTLGYSSSRFASKVIYNHRLSWIVNRGQIPAGNCVRHRCDNPRCINPDHLIIGTMRQNMFDKFSRGRNRTPVGRSVGMSVLNESQVLEMVALRKSGTSVEEISKRFNVEKPRLYRIFTGQIWSSVTGMVGEIKKCWRCNQVYRIRTGKRLAEQPFSLDGISLGICKTCHKESVSSEQALLNAELLKARSTIRATAVARGVRI